MMTALGFLIAIVGIVLVVYSIITFRPWANLLFAILGVCLFVGGVFVSSYYSNEAKYNEDWVILEKGVEKEYSYCWKLEQVSVFSYSDKSDFGWSYLEGHGATLSTPHKRARVIEGNWKRAYEELGITSEQCEALRELPREKEL